MSRHKECFFLQTNVMAFSCTMRKVLVVTDEEQCLPPPLPQASRLWQLFNYSLRYRKRLACGNYAIILLRSRKRLACGKCSAPASVSLLANAPLLPQASLRYRKRPACGNYSIILRYRKRPACGNYSIIFVAPASVPLVANAPPLPQASRLWRMPLCSCKRLACGNYAIIHYGKIAFITFTYAVINSTNYCCSKCSN